MFKKKTYCKKYSTCNTIQHKYRTKNGIPRFLKRSGKCKKPMYIKGKAKCLWGKNSFIGPARPSKRGLKSAIGAGPVTEAQAAVNIEKVIEKESAISEGIVPSI